MEQNVDIQEIDATVERIVEQGVLLVAKTKPLFKDHWRVEGLRQGFREKILKRFHNPIPGEKGNLAISVSDFLTEWNRDILQQDAFLNYQQVMLAQGETPLSEEAFRHSNPEPIYYTRGRHGRGFGKPDRIERRDCPAEHWRHIAERGIVPGRMVEDNTAFSASSPKQIFRVSKITPRCKVMLEGVEYPRMPHKLMVVKEQ